MSQREELNRFTLTEFYTSSRNQQGIKDLDLWSSDGLREAEEWEGEIDEAVLEHFQLAVTLNQLYVHMYTD